MIDVYEIAGRLPNENTLERRYRNHLRDVGLYDGPVEMERIRLELVRTNVHELEDIVHLTYHTDEALRMAKEATRQKRVVLTLPPNGSTTKAVRDSISDILRELRQPQGEIAMVERAQRHLRNASMKKIEGKYAHHHRIERAALDAILLDGLVDLTVAMGVPRDVLYHNGPAYDSGIARNVVRGGRYLLRTAERLGEREPSTHKTATTPVTKETNSGKSLEKTHKSGDGRRRLSYNPCW